MFKNSKLIELRNIQEEIRKLELEKPKSPSMISGSYSFIDMKYDKLGAFCNDLYRILFSSSNDDCDYLCRIYSSATVKEIGEYLIRTSKFYDNIDEWNLKINKLIEKEKHLKNKLGIR